MSAASLVRTCCVRQCAPGFWPCCCTAPWTHLQPDPPASHTAAEIIAVQASPWQSHLFLPCLLILTPLALKNDGKMLVGSSQAWAVIPEPLTYIKVFFSLKTPLTEGNLWLCQLVCLWGDKRECFWFEFECFSLLVLLGKVLKLLWEQISWFKAFKADSRHVSGYFHPPGQGLLVFFFFILSLLNKKGRSMSVFLALGHRWALCSGLLFWAGFICSKMLDCSQALNILLYKSRKETRFACDHSCLNFKLMILLYFLNFVGRNGL